MAVGEFNFYLKPVLAPSHFALFVHPFRPCPQVDALVQITTWLTALLLLRPGLLHGQSPAPAEGFRFRLLPMAKPRQQMELSPRAGRYGSSRKRRVKQAVQEEDWVC